MEAILTGRQVLGAIVMRRVEEKKSGGTIEKTTIIFPKEDTDGEE